MGSLRRTQVSVQQAPDTRAADSVQGCTRICVHAIRSRRGVHIGIYDAGSNARMLSPFIKLTRFYVRIESQPHLGGFTRTRSKPIDPSHE